MTETAPSHLDLDALADVLADEGEPRDTAHLSGCASCTSRLAELQAADARVAAALSTLPPPAVPAELADRLTAALAAEAPLRAGSAAVTALPAPGSRRRTWLPAAAAAVLLLSGAGIGYSLLGDGGSADSAGDSDTGATARPEVVVSASGTDYADPAAVSAALPGVLTGGEAVTLAQPDDSSAGGTGTERSTQEGSGAADAQAPAAAMIEDPLAVLRTPEGLAGCLVSLQEAPDAAPVEPLAVDYAMYDGAPALAVVLLDPDPAKLSVFVVGPGCNPADADLRHFVRVDAP